MRKIITIPILLLLVINIAAPFAMLVFRQQQVRREMKAMIRRQVGESALRRIDNDVHAKEIHWEEDEKEFILHGELFDVVKSRIENGHKIFLCLKDTDEESLLKAYARNVQTTGSKNPRLKFSIKFQQPDLINVFIQQKPIVTAENNDMQFPFADKLLSQPLDVQDQPPRC